MARWTSHTKSIAFVTFVTFITIGYEFKQEQKKSVDLLVFHDHMLRMLPVLGVSAFELSRAADASMDSGTSSTLFTCTASSLYAKT